MSDYGDSCSQIPENKCVEDLIRSLTIKEDSDEPFYVADLADIVNKYRTWKKMLPGIDPYYAVKCNNDPLVLRMLVAIGVGFDCASKGEIEAVLQAGAKASDIIFAHCFKYRGSLRYASSVGVDLMTFDSEGELKKIKAMCPRASVTMPAPLAVFTKEELKAVIRFLWSKGVKFIGGLQYNTGTVLYHIEVLILRIRIQNECAGFPLNKKFGCEFKECSALLRLAQKLNLDVVGISFHVGSLCGDPTAYSRGITLARTVFDLAEEFGYHLDILDIGGGYPGASGTFPLFEEMCSCIKDALGKHFPKECGVRIIAEPGCYFVCSAFTLCTTVVGRRESEENDDEKLPKRTYFLNDSVYGSFPVAFDKYGVRMKPLLTQAELRHRALMPSKLWGSTCCSMDCIFDNCLLPDLNLGECILFENSGAYTLSIASTFNGFPKPAVRHIYSSQYGSVLEKKRVKHVTCNDTALSVLSSGDITETLAAPDEALLNG